MAPLVPPVLPGRRLSTQEPPRFSPASEAAPRAFTPPPRTCPGSALGRPVGGFGGSLRATAEALEDPEAIPLLRARGRVLAKVRLSRTEGPATWRGYDLAARFDVGVGRALDLPGLGDMARELLGEREICAIRGALTDAGRAQHRGEVRRTLNEGGEDAPHWRDKARAWACFDIDGGDLGRDFDPADPAELRAAAELVRRLLPETVRQAGAVVAWSARAFSEDKRTPKAHVWMLLAEPRTSAEVKAWARATGAAVDLALLNPVQVHYTAAPVFIGGGDPVADRVVVLEGPRASIPRVEDPGVVVRAVDRARVRADLDRLDWTPTRELPEVVRLEVETARSLARDGRPRHNVVYGYGWRAATLYARGAASPGDLEGGAVEIGEALGLAGEGRAAEVRRTFRDGFQAGLERVEALDPIEQAEPEEQRPRYISAREVAEAGGRVILAADYGTGKTQAVADLTRSPAQDLLAVSPRVSLCEDASGRLGVTSYLASEGPIYARRIVVCGPSLPRIMVRDFGRVFIDESETLLGELFGSLYPRARSRARPATGFDAYRLLRRLCEEAGQVIVADANAGAVTRAFMESLASATGAQYPVTITRAHPLSGRALRVWDARNELVDDITRDFAADRRVFLACTTAGSARRLARRAEKARKRAGLPPGRVLCFTGDTPEAVKLEGLRDVSKVWGEAAVVVVSPAVESGVSYDASAPRFDRVVLFAEKNSPRPGEGADAASLGQMVERVRDRSAPVDAYFDAGLRHDLSCEVEDVRAELLERFEAVVAEAGGCAGVDWNDPMVRDYFELAVVYEVEKRRRTKDVRASFVRRWRGRGGEVEAVRGALRAAHQVAAEAKKAAERLEDTASTEAVTEARQRREAAVKALRQVEKDLAPARELDREVAAEDRIEWVRGLCEAAILSPGRAGRPVADADTYALERAEMVEVFGAALVAEAVEAARPLLPPRDAPPAAYLAAVEELEALDLGAGNLLDADRAGGATRAARALADLTLAVLEAEGDTRGGLALTASDRAQAATGAPGAVRPRAEPARRRRLLLAAILGGGGLAAVVAGEDPEAAWSASSLAIHTPEGVTGEGVIHTPPILFSDLGPPGVDHPPRLATEAARFAARFTADPVRVFGEELRGLGLRTLSTRARGPDGIARNYRLAPGSAAVATRRAAELVRRALAGVTAPEPT